MRLVLGVWLETGQFRNNFGIKPDSIPLSGRPQLELLQVGVNNSPSQLVHPEHLWKPLAELVQSSDWPFRSSNAPKNYGTGLNWSVCSVLFTRCVPSASDRSWSFSFCVLQVASEKVELSAALIEYEKDINLLESLYNNNKALFDQHELDTDLRELAGYASRLQFAARSDQTMVQSSTRPRQMAELDQSEPGQEEAAGS